MTLDNLLRIGKLRPHAADKAEIARLLDAAERALSDAAVPDVSTDTRLDAAYRAIMQAALVAMLANGYRPVTSEAGHHQLLIQALPKETLIKCCEVRTIPNSCELNENWFAKGVFFDAFHRGFPRLSLTPEAPLLSRADPTCSD